MIYILLYNRGGIDESDSAFDDLLFELYNYLYTASSCSLHLEGLLPDLCETHRRMESEMLHTKDNLGKMGYGS